MAGFYTGYFMCVNMVLRSLLIPDYYHAVFLNIAFIRIYKRYLAEYFYDSESKSHNLFKKNKSDKSDPHVLAIDACIHRSFFQM